MKRSSLLHATGALERRPAPRAVAGAGVALAEGPGRVVTRADWRLVRWLFVASLLLYLFTTGSNFSSGDAQSELRVTQALVDHGWFDVPHKPGQTCGGWGCQGAHGRFYATHGIGYSLYLLPFYVAALATTHVLDVSRCVHAAQPRYAYSGGWDNQGNWDYCVPIHLISWSNSLLSAATLALLCLICLELGYSRRRALALALLYGFGTLAWPYARFGFDVTLTALLLLAAYREALRAPATRIMTSGWWRCGVFAALALLVRLPAAAAIVPLVLFMAGATWRRPARERLRAWLALLAPLALAVAFTCWYNWVRFGSASPLADGHAGNAAEQLTTMPLVSLAGMLISPGKGVLWYAPPVVLALLCVPAFHARHRAACALTLAIATFGILPYLPVRDWIGGAAWGPRFVVQVLPFLVLPASEMPAILRTARARVLAALLVVEALCIQLAGVLVDYHVRLAQYRGVDQNRLIWDPRYSPLGDHLGTLWWYIMHWQTARLTSDKGVSFDVWWLNLWRNDGKSPSLTLLAAGVLAALAALACARLAVVARAARAPG